MEINFNVLGIPGVPRPIHSAPQGSIYATMLDSIPARSSLIIQVLRSNLSAGHSCVLVTSTPPDDFLRTADSSGVDFRSDIAQGRLFLFSREDDFVGNMFRHGSKRFLMEFDYFQVPKGSFLLFDQAGELFTLSDKYIAQTQVIDYRSWMNSWGCSSLFLFLAKDEQIPHSILSYFNGVARITQSKTAIELLIDFWYSQDGAIAAKAFPASLDASGLLRISHALDGDIDDHGMERPRDIALAPEFAEAIVHAIGANLRVEPNDLVAPVDDNGLGDDSETPPCIPGEPVRSSQRLN